VNALVNNAARSSSLVERVKDSVLALACMSPKGSRLRFVKRAERNFHTVAKAPIVFALLNVLMRDKKQDGTKSVKSVEKNSGLHHVVLTNILAPMSAAGNVATVSLLASGVARPLKFVLIL